MLGLIGSLKPVLVQSHEVCKKVEHPQPELIVFFGVTSNSRQPVLKEVCDCSLFAMAVEVMNPI